MSDGFGNCYDTDEREEIERDNERNGLYDDDDYYKNNDSYDSDRGFHQNNYNPTSSYQYPNFY
jgi:hypothetical protein